MIIRIKIKRAPGFGNLVSNSERKVRRKFCVNKQRMSFYSDILKQNIKITGGTDIMRMISAYGNIDRYLNLSKVRPEFVYLQRKLYKQLNNRSKLNTNGTEQ